MQLKIQRSQRMGGVWGTTIVFALDVRAVYAPHEAANIRKYKLGNEVIYNSRATKKHLEAAGTHIDRTQEGTVGNRLTGAARGVVSLALAAMNLNISIGSLGKGHHIECKDLAELMEAEEAVMVACRNVRDYLKLAASFDGSTILVDFSGDEEQVHTAMGGEVYAHLPAAARAEALGAGEGDATDAEFREMPDPEFSGPPPPLGAPEVIVADFETWLTTATEKLVAYYQAHPRQVWIGSGVAAFLAACLVFTDLLLVTAVGIAIAGLVAWRVRYL